MVKIVQQPALGHLDLRVRSRSAGQHRLSRIQKLRSIRTENFGLSGANRNLGCAIRIHRDSIAPCSRWPHQNRRRADLSARVVVVDHVEHDRSLCHLRLILLVLKLAKAYLRRRP